MPSSCKASRLPSAASSPTRERPDSDRSRSEPIRRRASCARARGAPQAPCGRRPSPSGRESHGGACARACWVDRSASRVGLRIPIVGEKIGRAPDLKRANANSAATADATKRRAGKMNAALEAPLQGRAYAAPARASQSRAGGFSPHPVRAVAAPGIEAVLHLALVVDGMESPVTERGDDHDSDDGGDIAAAARLRLVLAPRPDEDWLTQSGSRRDARHPRAPRSPWRQCPWRRARRRRTCARACRDPGTCPAASSCAP